MSTDILEKVKLLPLNKQMEVEILIDNYLKTIMHSELSGEELAKKRLSLMGRYKGQIWMADDFNETPSDFKNYM